MEGATEREDCVYMAKLAEQAERYDRLSKDGQEYVDQRMKEYDDRCATSAEC